MHITVQKMINNFTTYKGTYDANMNEPNIINGNYKGEYYIISFGGNNTPNNVLYEINDIIYNDGYEWKMQKNKILSTGITLWIFWNMIDDVWIGDNMDVCVWK